MSEVRIIRRLGQIEVNKLTTEIGRYFLRSLRIKTKYDLFEQLGGLNKSIAQWIQMHPFLRAIVKEINGQFHFVYHEMFANDSNFQLYHNKKLPNVEYLRVRSSDFTTEPDKAFEEL